MLTKAFFMTTALVLCAWTASAVQQTGTPGAYERGAGFNNPNENDANARFIAWYGKASHFPLRNGSEVLYQQSASSDFAKYAVSSWENDSAHYYPYGASRTLAADDFIIPGTGAHTITSVYAEGVIEPEDDLDWVNVIFFSDLRYDKKTETTTAVVKANCPYMPFSDETGTGDLLVNVTSCDTGTFKAGHDYAVSVQPESPDLVWYWQTNRKRHYRPALWWDEGGGNGSCFTQLTPIKTCFPTKGYGPDLAFAIIGN